MFPNFAYPPFMGTPYGYGMPMPMPAHPAMAFARPPVAHRRPVTTTATPTAGPSQEAFTAARIAAIEEEVNAIKADETKVLGSGKQLASEGWILGYEARKNDGNPMSDKVETGEFHHLEFYVGDALTVMKRFRAGLGMRLVARSDRNTSNFEYSSYILESENLRFVITSPASPHGALIARREGKSTAVPDPDYNGVEAAEFFTKHGLAVRAIAVTTPDATVAFETAVANGGIPVRRPRTFANGVTVSEIQAYGDVVMRFVSGADDGSYLPDYEAVNDDASRKTFGLYRFDHVVGNVFSCKETFEYFNNVLGWHRFAEFSTEDVGTKKSGINSIVIANNAETILLPINEPMYGTPSKSQITIFLEQMGGAGVQHLALKTGDVFATFDAMNAASDIGFEFLPPPPEVVHEGRKVDYYTWAASRVGDSLSAEDIAMCKERGILIDIHPDEGILLQIFTKPLGTRPTIFIEILERRCFIRKDGSSKDPNVDDIELDPLALDSIDKSACAQFGAGNFKKLYETVEADMGDLS